jgi:tetratricopeptide (TPR) repeat protein
VTVPDSQPHGLAVPAVWGNVPQRNKNFTGRDRILADLRQQVTTEVTVLLPHALQGMGGVGKTSVAIEYAYRYQADYDLVWWIPADQPALVRASLAALAGQLGLQSAAVTGIESAATAVLDALRRGVPYNRWLLIFDNADQPEELNAVIPRGPGHVLITSRNHRWQAVVETLALDVFSRAESGEFLRRRISGVSESEADQLADELGDLPLALEQAGALQAETGMSVEEYLRLLHGHVAEIMGEGRSPEYPLSMTATLRLSAGRLAEQLPEALELLRCLAFFGPEPIPRDLLRRSSQLAETRVGELVADPILLARAIRQLARHALLKIDRQTIQVHRLIQALIRGELSPSEQMDYQHEVHLLVAAGAPADPNDRKLWPRFAQLVPHVLAPAADFEGCHHPEVRRLVLNMIRYLYASGDRSLCRSVCERFGTRWEHDSGPDDPHVLSAQRYLGNALRELGQIQAAYAVVEAAAQRARAVLGEQDPLTLSLNSTFGADLRARGDFRAALALDQELLRLYEAGFGEDDPQTLRALSNLALDCVLTSEYRRALELYRRSYLKQSDAEQGVSVTDVLSSWTGLALALRCNGNYPEARDVSEDAYDFGREVVGADHYLTVRAAISLSIGLRQTGPEDDDALEFASEAFSRCARLFGEGNPDTLAAAINYANLLRTLDQLDRATELTVSTVERYEAVYGPEHPYSYCTAGDLALLKRAAGDLDRARELNEAALFGLDAKLSRDHHYSLAVATNLASDLAALGDVSGARELGEDTLRRLTRLLGDAHPLSLGCATNLATDLRADGAAEAADQLLTETQSQFAGSLGSDHPTAVRAAAGRRINADFDPPPI